MITNTKIQQIISKHKKPQVYKQLKLLNAQFNIALFPQQYFQLGKGTFSKCYMGKLLKKQQNHQIQWQFNQLVQHDRIVAIKVIKKDPSKCSPQRYKKQIEILSQLQKDKKCQNIIKIFDIKCQTQKNYYIVMQYCNNCTLYDLIQNRKTKRLKFTLNQFIQITLDLINGYQVLKRNDILHLDLKPQNILIKNKIFKIADFGLAMKLNNQNSKKVNIGTWIYASPQQLSSNNSLQIDHKTDIFALGLILYQLLFGHHPYYKPNNYTQFIQLKYAQYKQKGNLTQYNIKKMINLQYLKVCKDIQHPQVNLEYDKKNQKVRQIIDQLKDIVIKMCVLDRKYRYSLSQIVQKLSKIQFNPYQNKQKNKKNEKNVNNQQKSRQKLFIDLNKISKSYLDFNITKMDKYLQSMVQANRIQLTPSIRQTQKHTITKINSLKTHIQITLQYLQTIFLLKNIIHDHLTQPTFITTFSNYCYFINIAQYNRTLHQYSLMNKQQQRIALRQQIQYLIIKMRQNDFQFQKQISLDIIYYKKISYYQQLLQNVSIMLDKIIIKQENIGSVAAMVVLMMLIEYKEEYKDDTTNFGLRLKMNQYQSIIGVIKEMNGSQEGYKKLKKFIQEFMDSHNYFYAYS